jgi:two-component system CheB/CheR fusion protein
MPLTELRSPVAVSLLGKGFIGMVRELTKVPVVGVGASAGGRDALESFFRGMPVQSGLAFVVVTHLQPLHESILHQVIAQYTGMLVEVAVNGTVVQPDHIYVLGANAVVEIEDGRLKVVPPAADGRETRPVDIFLISLAIDRGQYAAGVILSGGDGDGALGLKAIKERAGLSLAQVSNGFGPSSRSMPDAAISTGLVDFAMPVGEMGQRLAEFAHGLTLLDGIADDSTLDGESKSLDEERLEIYGLVRNQTGHDFSGYKTKTFIRRVQRRMQIVRLETMEAYVERLRKDAAEITALYKDLLINVTNFFRDDAAFEALASQVIPKLFEGRGAEDTIRVWIPGCATGEEVYSVAILLLEHIASLSAAPRCQIFATDIDDHALTLARTGRYPTALLDSVSAERRERFFVLDGATYVLRKEVRELAIFSPHSVLKDPPFSRIDLVSCRNLLIYLAEEAQAQVIPTFHYALRPGGYLFLGTSENVSQFRGLFTPIDPKQRIFQSRDDVVPSYHLSVLATGKLASGSEPDLGRSRSLAPSSLRHTIQAQIMDRFSPAHVVVNAMGELIYLSGRTGRYLEAPPGTLSRNVLSMARRGLQGQLRSALHRCVETGTRVSQPGIRVHLEEDRVQVITLTVEPVADKGQASLFLIVFTNEGSSLSADDMALSEVPADDDRHSEPLERELWESRDKLQTTIEEYETALEELKSSNEELQSVNEEYQSSNEELEASKEELQSLNEELHTVNGELQLKINELDRANNDLENLFDATNIATVFLDQGLIIKNFTPAVGKLFNILPLDRGRPITDLAGPLKLPNLTEDIALTMRGTTPLERRIHKEDDGRDYLVKLAPYHDEDRRIKGAVVTFVDVTTLTQAEVQARLLVAELQHRTRNLLGIVLAIARRTLDQGEQADRFRDRLGALGRVQGLLSEAKAKPVELGELLRLELQANGISEDDVAYAGRILIGGPAVDIGMTRMQPVALVLHELVTNAIRHGALEEAGGGALQVLWSVDAEGGLVLDWRESGLELPETEEGQDGYGMQIIRRSLGGSLQAETDLRFGPGGITCRIRFAPQFENDGAAI